MTDTEKQLAAALAENKLLRELVKAKDDLLVCYRIGKRPSESLFKRLDKYGAALAQPSPTECFEAIVDFTWRDGFTLDPVDVDAEAMLDEMDKPIRMICAPVPGRD